VLQQLAGPLLPPRPAPALSTPATRADTPSPAPLDGAAGLAADRLSFAAVNRFGSLLDAVPDALVIVNAAGLIVLANAQTERLFGYARAELLGRPVELLVPERFRERHVAQRDGFFAEPKARPMGIHRDLYGRHKDGHDIPVEISLNPLRTEEGLLVVSSIRDISARKKTEAQLRKMEARYRTLVEGIPAVTFIAALDEDLRELYVSPQIEALLGFSQKEWLENPVLWHAQLHPDDRPRWHGEFARTVASGEPFRSVYRFLARDGRVVWVHGEAKVVRDGEGRPLFLQGVAFDITGMKEAEEALRALNQTLEQRVRERTEELARSNFALEQFASRVTHDLKEPLRTIKSYIQMLVRGLREQLDPKAQDCVSTPELRMSGFFMREQLDPKAQDCVTRIINAASRMEVLINDLLAYSRVGTQGKAPEPAECAVAVGSACAMLQAAIEESGAEVTAGELPVVQADATQLMQLFQNLFANALKFRSDRPPKIHVSARREGGDWLLSVADNGIGIEPKYLEKQEKLFGLGERLHTRRQYPGHGIGLATCEKIVQRHGGRIWAESAGLGQGSTFCFTLPAAERG
jgi:PAS domain S-box-containing protein